MATHIHLSDRGPHTMTPERVRVLWRILGITEDDWRAMRHRIGASLYNVPDLYEIDDTNLGAADVIDHDGLVPFSVIVTATELWMKRKGNYPRFLCAELTPAGEFIGYVELTSMDVVVRQWDANGEMTLAMAGVIRHPVSDRVIRPRIWNINR